MNLSLSRSRPQNGISGLGRHDAAPSLCVLWTVVLLCLGVRLPVVAAVPLGQWVLSKTNLSGGMVRNQAGPPDGQFVGPLTLTSDPEAVLFDGLQNFVQLSPALAPTALPRTNLSVGAWVAMRSAGQWPGMVGCL